MRSRLPELIGVAAVFIAVTALLQLAPTPVVGQAQTDPGQEAATPTPWGDPDLQGIWTTRYDTPLQRPTRYADQEFFTDEERAELDRVRAGSIARNDGRTQYAVGAYDAAIFLTHKHTGRRTSLIVDPPDGRIPPLTPRRSSDGTRYASISSPSCRPRTSARTTCPPAKAASTGRRHRGERSRLRTTRRLP